MLRCEYHRKRHAAALELVARDPDNPVRLDNLCISHIVQARLIGDADRAASVEHVRQARELADRIVAAEPLNAQYAFTFSRASFLQLEELLRVGDVQPARPILERLITVAEDMHRRDPDGHWGRVLKERRDEARLALAGLVDIPAVAGSDLRHLLPDHGEISEDCAAASGE